MLKKFFEEQSAAQSGDIESDRQGSSSVAGCPVGRQSTPKQSFVNIIEWCPDPTDQSGLKESACIYEFWKMIFLKNIYLESFPVKTCFALSLGFILCIY